MAWTLSVWNNTLCAFAIFPISFIGSTKEIYFTSCGSESDNLAIKGICYKNRERKNHIITTKIEHPAVLHTCESLEKQGHCI